MSSSEALRPGPAAFAPFPWAHSRPSMWAARKTGSEGITLRADMPGVSKDGLNLRVEGNSLLLEGTIGLAPQEKMTALYADVRSTIYRRQFVLSGELETGKIEANLQNGVLTIQIPKRAELRPRRIEVSG